MREYVNHYGAIRLRVNGVGNLKNSFISQDDVQTAIAVPIVMKVADPIEPNRLTNFISQRAMLKLSVTEIDEWFEINRIVIYAKTVGTGYPNNG